MSEAMLPTAAEPADAAAVRSRIHSILRSPSAVSGIAIFAIFLLAGIFGRWLSPYGSAEIVAAPLQSPSGMDWLGTDEIGRDILTRMMSGAAVSIEVGALAALIAMVVGVPWGLVSGYYGGAVDRISMRVTDGMLAFPAIVLAMAMVAVVGPSVLNIVLAVGILQIPSFSRLVRAETMRLRSLDFVSAAIAAGARDLYVLRRAILPNAVPTIIVQFTLSFAVAVLTEAGLSFLGLGIQPPQASWGGMLATAKNFMDQQFLYVVLPAAAIFLLVLSLSMLGDGLRDALEPDRPRSG